MKLITSDTLPVILGLLLTAEFYRTIRGFGRGFLSWRKGAKEYEKDIMRRTQQQLADCDEELQRAEKERDKYRQQVGRRDYIILSHNLDIPKDEDQ